MKKLTFLIALLCLTLTTYGQILDPIRWETSATRDGETVEITFKANMDKGWHLYGLEMPEYGPMPTTFEFESLKGAELSGKINAKSPSITKYEETFELDLTWFENEAIFTQKIKIKDPKIWEVNGSISFMVCNDETCMPGTPVDFHFDQNNTKELKKGKTAESTTKQDKTIINAEKVPAVSKELAKEKPAESNAKQDKTIIIEEKSPAVSEVEIENENESDASKTDTIIKDSVDTRKNIAQAETTKAKTIESNNDIYTPVIEQLKELGETTTSSDSSIWKIFLLGLLGGLIALFTPCVWPIIPMTVSFFLKRSGDKKKGRRDAFIYGISIIIIYLTLGLLVTGIFGASALNSLSTNAVFNIIFFLMLVVFAISFFGAFEITLPASWSSKMDAKAESTTGFLSILLMAFTLVLVSFSCTGPIIGTLLVEAAQGSWLGPAVGMFGFALALAFPFSLFAMFPSMLKSMPKSGGWLNSVKVVLGFLELALSLKFLSVADLAYGWGILDRETFIALWVVIFALLGMYLLGKITLPHDDKVERIGVTRLMLALISFAYAIYLIPGLWGAPLRSASAFAPPLSTQDFNLYENEVHADANDFEIGMKLAQTSKKPVLIDFSGYGCVNCRKMEAAVWTDPTVADMLSNDFTLVTLMVDDRTPLTQPMTVTENGKKRVLKTVGDKNSYIQRHKFGANAQPFYVIVDANGNPIVKSYAFDEDPENFIKYLKNAIIKFKEK